MLGVNIHQASPVKIRVKDVLPTVSNSEIKVELTDATRACKAPEAAAGCSLTFSHEVTSLTPPPPSPSLYQTDSHELPFRCWQLHFRMFNGQEQ